MSHEPLLCQVTGARGAALLDEELVRPGPLLPVAGARRHRFRAAVGRAGRRAAPPRQLSPIRGSPRAPVRSLGCRPAACWWREFAKLSGEAR